MSSCKGLAERYASETGKAIPSSDASFDTKNNWLYTQEWKCILPGTTKVLDHDQCMLENDRKPPDRPKSDLATRPPVYNYLEEDGFLAWVNERGLKCINGIVGNYYGLNTKTGNSNTPGPSVSPPNSQCWGTCFKATSDSETCFECINQVLLDDPTRCPSINPKNPDDQTLMRDAVSCHECVGIQGGFIQSKAANAKPGDPDLDAMLTQIWRCITGKVGGGFSSTDIIVVVVASVFVLAVAITLGLYFGYFHPRIVASQQKKAKFQSLGLRESDY